MSSTNQKHPPSGSLPEEEEIIELTEVLGETPAEVILELGAGEADLKALKVQAGGPFREEPPEAASAAAKEDSLEDLLASLPELPEDLDIPAEAPALEIKPAAPLREELARLLPEAELKELVRQVIQETVERLARELLPELAAQALERQIQLLKKRLLAESPESGGP